METWKPVIGYELTHEVSNLGRVRSCDQLLNGRNGGLRPKPGRILKPYQTKAGYTAVQFRHKDKRHFIHRLVAEAFLGARTSEFQVNHINGVKDDNRPENLEWCTPAQNQAHALKSGLRRTGGETNLASSIRVFNAEGQFLSSHNSLKSAADTLQLNYKTFCSMLHQGYLTYKGYRFEYTNKRVGNARLKTVENGLSNSN